MSELRNGDRIHLVDKKGRLYALTLKAGDIYQYSGETIPHDELIGKPDGSLVTLSRGKRFLALRPTLGEYVAQDAARCPSPVSEGPGPYPHVGGCVSGGTRV